MDNEQKKYISNLTYNLAAVTLGIVGFVLLFEHVSVWGNIDLYDFIGHETYGIIFILLGLLMFIYKSKQIQLIKDKFN